MILTWEGFMVKASLSLEKFRANGITGQMATDFAKDWQNIPHISNWLKVRGFELTKPILVSEEDNNLTFFQKDSELSSRKVVIIHPIQENLTILSESFKLAGHQVFAFATTEAAVKEIGSLLAQGITPEFVILPKDLRTSQQRAASSVIRQLFPTLIIKEAPAITKVESSEEIEARKRGYAEQGQMFRLERFLKTIEIDSDIEKNTKYFFAENHKAVVEIFSTVSLGLRLSLWNELYKRAATEKVCKYDMNMIWKRSRNVL
jgi:hypothetical protein